VCDSPHHLHANSQSKTFSSVRIRLGWRRRPFSPSLSSFCSFFCESRSERSSFPLTMTPARLRSRSIRFQLLNFSWLNPRHRIRRFKGKRWGVRFLCDWLGNWKRWGMGNLEKEKDGCTGTSSLSALLNSRLPSAPYLFHSPFIHSLQKTITNVGME